MTKKPYFVTLTGAKKNIGDFLITYRCEKLLKEFKPEYDLVKLPHWEPLDDKLQLVNQSRGIIILGGPGYQKSMYPTIYKLTENLDDIKVPIIPLGLGWKGFLGDFQTLQNYRFDEASIKLLKKMSEGGLPLSCRDYYSAEALRNNGVDQVLMTGCPVWYNLDYIGSEMDLPSEVKSIVYTPAQMEKLSLQSIAMMQMLKEQFSNAKIYCSFHRGIGTKDIYTPQWDVVNTAKLAEKARAIGLIPVDTAYDLAKIGFYKQCDLHVGYRVHAHIFFLSMRKPSLLIHEDGRGLGVSEALNINGINAFIRKRINSKSDQKSKIRRFVSRFTSKSVGVNCHCTEEVKFQLLSDISNGFIRYKGLSNVIDENFLVMKSYIESIDKHAESPIR